MTCVFLFSQWKKQLSPSRRNQLMPINSVPRFVVFRYIKSYLMSLHPSKTPTSKKSWKFHVLEHQKLHPDPSQPGIVRYTCTWTLIDNLGNDQLARPCIFSKSVNYFLCREIEEFISVSCHAAILRKNQWGLPVHFEGQMKDMNWAILYFLIEWVFHGCSRSRARKTARCGWPWVLVIEAM